MGDWKKDAPVVADWRAEAPVVEDERPRTEGGAEGGGGSDSAPPKSIPHQSKFGGPADFLKSFADTAALGAGPQIEGVMAAIAQDGSNLLNGEPLHPKTTPAEAYEAVRDMGEREHAESAKTAVGNIAQLPGMLATPIPVKALPRSAALGQKALRGGVVGGGVGAVQGAINSSADLTSKDDVFKQYAQMLLDAGAGGVGGFAAGTVTGGTLGLLEKPLRSTARKLPMDMLGVGEPARRSMQRQGIYDDAGDELLNLIRPLRSGMRKASLTEDAVTELQKRGIGLDDAIEAVDQAAPTGVTDTGAMAAATRGRASPFAVGSVQDKQVAARMNKEANNMLTNHGDLLPEVPAPLSLAEAEAFKQRFGPAVAKQLRHAGEPAAKTDALAETYRALKNANEEAARAVDPALAGDFIGAKKSYQRLAAPLEGANVERAGMRSSDFDWGDALTNPAPPAPGWLAKLTNSVPVAGPLITGGLNLAGRAYGRGTAAKLAEFLANGAEANTGGGVGGIAGQSAESALLGPYLDLLEPENQK